MGTKDEKEFLELYEAFARQGARYGHAVAQPIIKKIKAEMSDHFIRECLAAWDNGQTFDEWFHGEDPDKRFWRWVRMSPTAYRWWGTGPVINAEDKNAGHRSS